MTRAAFVDNKPVATDNGLDVVDDIRNNLMAMRDAVSMGVMPGWNYSLLAGTGTTEQPQFIYLTKGNERLRGTLTWGTTGGEEGNCTAAVWDYTVDYTLGTPVWDAIGTETTTFDSSGNVTAVTWS